MKRLFLSSIIIVLLVYLISVCYKEEVDNNYNFIFSDNSYIRVKRNSNGTIERMPFEDYIVGVVAGEMPASFDIEALKAQAVASRSYALTKMLQNVNNQYDVIDTIANQVYLDEEKLRNNWKNSYDENIAKVKEAVLKTKGEYLTYKGNVVNALFFSTSVGKTENVSDVFGSKLPYLVSVDSSWEENVSPVFKVNYTYSLNDFYAGLNIPYSKNLTIKAIDTTSTGRIKKVLINNIEFTGSEVASKLSLKSAYFIIEQQNDMVLITTKGYGHGVGMSQYGAYGMAKLGYKYKDILKHYYTGVEISKM